MPTLREQGEIQRMTDDELRALARGTSRGGGRFGERPVGDFAAMELERRRLAAEQDTRYAKRRRERAAARTAPPDSPLDRIRLLGVELNDQDRRNLMRFVRAVIEEELYRVASVGLERSWADDEDDNQEEVSDGHG